MKVLLEEMIDVRFRLLLPGHDVFSVDYMKWKGVKNGALIAVAAAALVDRRVAVAADCWFLRLAFLAEE